MKIVGIRVEGDSGEEYEIAVGTDGEATCTCLAFRFNQGPCKHIRFVAKTVAS